MKKTTETTETIESILANKLLGRRLVKLDGELTDHRGVICKVNIVNINGINGLNLETVNSCQTTIKKILLPFDQNNTITTEG